MLKKVEKENKEEELFLLRRRKRKRNKARGRKGVKDRRTREMCWL